MKLYVDDMGIRVGLADGGEIEVRVHDGSTINGLVGELGDSETFVCGDGCTITRRGDEAIWWTPPPRR